MILMNPMKKILVKIILMKKIKFRKNLSRMLLIFITDMTYITHITYITYMTYIT